MDVTVEWTRRQLEALVAIAERNNISHAAHELGLSQPTVSRMLSRIEAGLDVVLFDRDVNGAVPNAAGRLLVEAARNSLRTLDDAVDEIRSLDGRLVGRVCVAMPDTTGHTLFIPLLDRFGDEHPDVELRVMASHPSGVPLALASGDADVGIVSSAHRQGGVDRTPLVNEQLHLIGSPLAGRPRRGRSVRLAQVARLPLVVPAIQPGLRTLIDAAFASRQLRPVIEFEVDAEEALVELTATGRAYSIMSFAGVARLVERGQLEAWPITDPPIVRTLSTALPQNRNVTRLMLSVQHAIHALATELAPTARWQPC